MHVINYGARYMESIFFDLLMLHDTVMIHSRYIDDTFFDRTILQVLLPFVVTFVFRLQNVTLTILF